MAKKKEATKPVDQQVNDAEVQAKMRLDSIKAFNEQNAGKYFIDPVKIPGEDDIARAKQDFDNFNAELSKKEYLIADKENALRVTKFLRAWLDDGFWTQRFFVGVVNFADLLDKFIAECETEAKDFVLDYGPMQFCYLLLENYAGIGIESAKKMAEKYNEYIPIYDTFREHVEWYNAQQEKAKELQQRYGLFQQGYWYEILDNKEETVETDEKPVEETKE